MNRFNIPIKTNLVKADIHIYQNCIDAHFYSNFITFERYIRLNTYGICLIRRKRK